MDAAGASQYAELLLSAGPAARQVTWIAESAPIPSHVVISRMPASDRGREEQRFVDRDADAQRAREQGELLAHTSTAPIGYVSRPTRRTFDGVRKLIARPWLSEVSEQ